MKHTLPILALSLLLLAQTCEPPVPPGNPYCAGAVNETAESEAVAIPSGHVVVAPGEYSIKFPDGNEVGPLPASEVERLYAEKGGDIEPWAESQFVVIEEGSILDMFLDELRELAEWSYTTIVGGTPSVDRRSTVFVSIVGIGSCSGVILGPHTVLTAGHCIDLGPAGHRVYLDRTKPNYYTVTSFLRHPGYPQWSSGRGEPHDDLALLYVNETLPLPYAGGFYENKYVNLCEGMVAQGWGQTEVTTDPNYIKCPDGNGDGVPDAKCLRESPYTVFLEGESWIKTKQLTPGGICFGDSGGPLYAMVKGQPEPYLAGITSTTASTDCKVSSTHVKVSYYKNWIIQNFEPPQ
jgi:Trypsin